MNGTLWTYKWDVPGSLLQVSRAGAAQGVYAYDGTGRRVESVEGSTVTYYAYLRTETLYEKSGTAQTDYVFAAGLCIARVSGTTTSYYHTDSLGSTRLVRDSSKTVLFSEGYQPFGQDNGAPGSETFEY